MTKKRVWITAAAVLIIAALCAAAVLILTNHDAGRAKAKKYVESFGWHVHDLWSKTTHSRNGEPLNIEVFTNDNWISLPFMQQIEDEKIEIDDENEYTVYKFDLEEMSFYFPFRAYVLYDGSDVVCGSISSIDAFSKEELEAIGVTSGRDYDSLNMLERSTYFPINMTAEEIRAAIIEQLNKQ